MSVSYDKALKCVYCRAMTKTHKQMKHRYSDIYANGNITGIASIVVRFCKACKLSSYVRYTRLNNSKDWEEPEQVDLKVYLKAELSCGSIRIGSTASEYTKRISRPVDDGAMLNYLKTLNMPSRPYKLP